MGDWAFSYDQLDRLSTATALANQTTTPQDYTSLNLCWGYDAFGNRTYEASVKSAACSSGSAKLSWATYTTSNNQMAISSYGRMAHPTLCTLSPATESGCPRSRF